MQHFIDLSHCFEDGMLGFKMKNEDGSFTQYTARIRPFLTHEQTNPKFAGQCSFEITEMTFQTSVGTYLDAPYHRYPQGRDISELRIDELILPGVVIDVRGRRPWEAAGPDVDPVGINLEGKAVMFNFGWDQYWGQDAYQAYPYISQDLITLLIRSKVRLVGVDTVNIDNAQDLMRPAHTFLLEKEIFIVENLTNLQELYSHEFRFFAVPVKGKRVAAMPVRAFAQILS